MEGARLPTLPPPPFLGASSAPVKREITEKAICFLTSPCLLFSLVQQLHGAYTYVRKRSSLAYLFFFLPFFLYHWPIFKNTPCWDRDSAKAKLQRIAPRKTEIAGILLVCSSGSNGGWGSNSFAMLLRGSPQSHGFKTCECVVHILDTKVSFLLQPDTIDLDSVKNK